MSRLRVLFVDDEPNILAGLQRMLRPLRNEWEVRVAEGGEKALDLLANERFDAIVSDMRMPGMDGAQLLQLVKERHPLIIRVALSGHSDASASLRLAGIAHQYLSKPCEADQLRETLARAEILRSSFRSERVQAVINRASALPSLPKLYADIETELRSAEPSLQRVGEIIGRDPAMCAKVLQLVNSAFFALPRRVNSAEMATRLLGLETIRSLVLTVHVFSQFRGPELDGLSLSRMWSHSMLAGAIGRELARSERSAEAACEAVPMASLLHDVGMLVLAHNFPAEYRAVIARVEHGQAESMLSAETAEFGATHPEVGGYLLGLWGLPGPLVEAVSYHHLPSASIANGFGPVVATHVATALAGHDGEPAAEDEELDEQWLAGLGLAARLQEWRRIGKAVRERV